MAVGADENVVQASGVKQLKARIQDLERLLGKKTMEAEILSDGIEIAHGKKLLLRRPLPKKGDSR